MMEIGSKYVGAEFREYKTEIAWRQTTNFAAATNDANPCYLDDERPKGLVAPPMLAAALTWPVTERLKDFIRIDDFPAELLDYQVHYSESIEFYRLIRPNDRLVIKGRVAAILPHRAGTHFIIRYEAFDGQGELVFTEFIGALLRGVSCADEGQSEDLPVTPQGPRPAEVLWEMPIFIDPLAPYVYDGCTDIVFPVHTSPRFAHQVGLPGIIYQGTATLALAAKELVNHEGGGDPGRLKALSCRWTAMVRPGTEIRVRLVGTNQGQHGQNLFFVVLNADGDKAVSQGWALMAD
ncbi:MAG: MaoC/PaaZ C-terminal domain-containing protein [Thermodesulfobacteriota bacterium]|nr:MaoC/PaaZ C-terminal domain-containing protein [Thermodesulfobacteriota bacterium]